MKIYTTCLLILVSIGAMAQKEMKSVTLQFNHLADSVKLEYNKGYKDWQNNSYTFTRSQFYESEISLKHNSGEVTDLTDYLLVDPETIEYDLGEHELGTLESIVFYVGVPQSVNHNDPSAYPSDHPLYPQNPSMHWGWASGYRFWALEGKIDANNDGVLNKVFQYHAVGNKYYTKVEVPTAGVTSGTDLTIYIDIIYQRLLQNVDIPNTVIEHGDGPAIDLFFNNLKATKSPVFVEGDDNVLVSNNDPHTESVDALQPKSRAFPNPFNDFTYIQYNFDGFNDLELVIADMMGKEIKHFENLPGKGEQKVSLNVPAGFYMYYFKKGDQIIFQDKLSALE